MPLPNYRLTYNGLGKIPALKDKVQSISISHGYKSQLQMNSYNTNTPDFDPSKTERKDPVSRNYYSELNIPGVVLNREFSPLIGIDVKLKNDLTFRVDMKKRYNLQMSFIDNQLAEQKQDDYSLNFGYKMKNVHLKFLDFMNFDQPNKKKDDGEKKNSIIKFKSQEDEKNAKPELDKNGKPIKKKKVKKGNDLTMNCGITLSDGVTYQTNLITGLRQPVRGDLTLKIAPSADYVVNKQLTLRFFMEFQQFTPKTSLSIPRTEAKGGVTLRFQLQ
jgi:cell surface protein SprA